MRIFMNKKGGVPWWLKGLIFALAVMFFGLIMLSRSEQGMVESFKELLKIW